MRPVRRALGVLAATLVAVGAVVVVPPAQAQDSGVTLQILRQSPWSSKDHRSTLTINVAAYNGGENRLTDLRMEVAFGPHIESRGDYNVVLASGPDTTISSVTQPVRGAVEPGDSRTIGITIDLAEVPGIDQEDSQTYPAVVQLLTGDTVLASLVTPVIYLVRAPEAPMLSSMWVQLPAPIAFGADGALVDTSFPDAIGPGGASREALDAISEATVGRHPHGPLDLVIDPMLVTQARDVADGYRTTEGTEVAIDSPAARQARTYLRTLESVVSAPGAVEAVANPYANPLLPAMVHGDLTASLAAQRVSGAGVIGTLGAAPITTVAKPAGGQLTDEVLDWLARVDTTVVLADAGTTDRSATQGFLAAAPTVPVTTSSGTETLVQPDPDTQALFDRFDLYGDPVRAAQIVLGELAVIWKEAPVPRAPFVRGIAVAPPPTLPPAMWSPLLRRITEAPFLEPVTATSLVERVDPPNPNTASALAAPASSFFDPAYADRIDSLRGRVEAYGSMLGPTSDIPIELRRKLFVSTAPPYVGDPSAGEPWLAAVDTTTQQAFDAVMPTVSQEFTFTSREGTIPILMGDPGDTPVRVTVELVAKDFSFPEGSSQSVLLDGPGRILEFQVVANTSGQNPIQVWVRAPNGQPLTDPPGPATTIVVRTTTVNHIALLVTIGAGLGLLVLYSRRWFRRRKNPA
jgi:hypothetical protein